MKSICNNCMNFPCTDGMSAMLKSCPEFEPIPKPQTNYDRIRAMSDEELAEFLDDVRDEWGCSHYPHGTEDWLDWLKDEATE